MNKKIFFAAAVIISSSAKAQQPDRTKNLDEVLVSTTKLPLKQSQTGKVITVIGKEQIEKSGGKTVAQVLNEQAGITINGALNAPGSVQTVYMRGASSGRTLVLIDGIPVSDPSMINGEFDLNLISLNDVERIEICKGSQSTLYGSDAIAGVINIITLKKDVKGPIHLNATFAGGNRGTVRANAQVYGKIGKLTYSTKYAKLLSNGFSSAYDSTSKGLDNDGFDGDVASAALQYQFIPSLQAKGFVHYSRYKTDADNAAFVDEKDFTINNKRWGAGGGLEFNKGRLAASLNYLYSETKRNYLNDSLDQAGFAKFEDNRYKARSQFAEIFFNIRVTNWLSVLIGADHRYTQMNQAYYSESVFGPYAPPSFDSSLKQTSGYASLFFSAFDKKLNIETGGRYNKNSRYGSNSTFTFDPSYIISKNIRVFGSVASGFKAPSIYQVFDQNSGNPDLKPERSLNYEIGLQYSAKRVNARLLYFRRDIKDGIDYDYVNYKYFNFLKQVVNGGELELSVKPVDRLQIDANYTFLSGEETTQSRKNFHDTTYNYLLRRPKHNINLNIGYSFQGGLFASVALKSVSKRYDVGGFMSDDQPLNEYILLNAYFAYRYSNALKLFLDVQNITHKKFFDTRGYNSIPFMINGGVTFTW